MDAAIALRGGLLLLASVAALEAWVLIRRGHRYEWGAYFASLADALGRGAINVLLPAGVAAAVLFRVQEWRFFALPMDRAWHYLALFLGVEFCYYWMHRADHRVGWFWLNHAVHHSPNQYTLASAYRLGWTGRIVGAPVFMAPLVLLGFPVGHVAAAMALNLLYQFWLHTELIGKLPRPVEWLLNTPAHHRVHHASNPEYLDCNYGGVLIVFDRLFGTFRAELPGVPRRYGLTEPVTGNNPLKIAFHAWFRLFRDLRRARGWRERIWLLLGPPCAGAARACDENAAAARADSRATDPGSLA